MTPQYKLILEGSTCIGAALKSNSSIGPSINYVQFFWVFLTQLSLFNEIWIFTHWCPNFENFPLTLAMIYGPYLLWSNFLAFKSWLYVFAKSKHLVFDSQFSLLSLSSKATYSVSKVKRSLTLKAINDNPNKIKKSYICSINDLT